MKGTADQEPAPVSTGKGNADAFVVRRYDSEVHIAVGAAVGPGANRFQRGLRDGPEIESSIFIVGRIRRSRSRSRRTDRQPDLHGFCRLRQVGNHGGNAFAFSEEPGGADNDAGSQERAVVQEVVIAVSSVAGGLDGKLAVRACSIQLNGFINDVAVASLKAQVLQAQSPLQIGMKFVAGYAVRNHRRSGIFIRDQSGGHGDDTVSADLTAVFVYGGGAVHIRIEYQAQVAVMILYSGCNCGHSLFILRVRDVVREMSVRLQELAGGDIRTERLKDPGRVESSGAVARVNGDLHSAQRLVCPGLGCYDAPQVGGIDIHQIGSITGGNTIFGSIWCSRSICRLRHAVQNLIRFRENDNIGNVAFVQAALRAEKLQPVAVPGKVARCDHDSAVRGEFREDCGHEHGRSGRHAAVQHTGAVGRQGVNKDLAEMLPGKAGVPPDGNSKFCRFLICFTAEPEQESPGETGYGGIVEIHRFAGDALQRDAADIAAVLQRPKIIIRHRYSFIIHWRPGSGSDKQAHRRAWPKHFLTGIIISYRKNCVLCFIFTRLCDILNVEVFTDEIQRRKKKGRCALPHHHSGSGHYHPFQSV